VVVNILYTQSATENQPSPYLTFIKNLAMWQDGSAFLCIPAQ